MNLIVQAVTFILFLFVLRFVWVLIATFALSIYFRFFVYFLLFFCYTYIALILSKGREVEFSKWLARLIYLSTILISFLFPFIAWQMKQYWGLWLFSSLSGSFFGMLVSTWRNYGILENNYPPSPETEKFVENIHQKILSEGEKNTIFQRIFNQFGALIGLIILWPLFALLIVLIWLEDPGPILFVKNSVGKGGRNFHQYKFRTMVHGAEEATGPIMASVDDDRTLKIGKFLRKTALDELPQLINIFIGEMAFVGPRPQRTILVSEYLVTLPEFAQRHSVLPGLAGLAQVAGSYYITPRQKLRYDRIYVRNASLGFDLKLLMLALALVFWFRWQKGGQGKIPRKWFRLFS